MEIERQSARDPVRPSGNPCADELVPDSWRVRNEDDIVTRLPSLLGYHHIGAEATLFPDGRIQLTGGSTDDIREGTVISDIMQKVQGKRASIPIKHAGNGKQASHKILPSERIGAWLERPLDTMRIQPLPLIVITAFLPALSKHYGLARGYG